MDVINDASTFPWENYTGPRPSVETTGSDALLPGTLGDDGSQDGAALALAIENVFSVVSVLLMIVTAFGNSLVLAAFIKFHSVRTVQNFFLASMAASDLMTAASVILALILKYSSSLDQLRALCVFTAGLYGVSFMGSFWNLLLVTLERYIAVNHPFCYPRVFSDRGVRILLTLCWIWVVGFNAVGLIDNVWTPGSRCHPLRLIRGDRALPMFLAITIVPFTAVNVMYARLAYVACKHRRQIHAQLTTVTIGIAHVTTPVDAQTQPVVGQPMAQYNRGTKTLGIILGLIYCSWLPTIVNPFYVGLAGRSQAYRIDIQILRDTGNLLLYVGPFFNPLVYHRRSQEFRTAFTKMLRLSSTTQSSDINHLG